MNGRRSNRIIVDLPAELKTEQKHYAGTIENFSDDGIYVVIPPLKSEAEMAHDMPVEIIFQLPTGEKLTLQTKVKWSYLTPPHGYTFSIGLEVIDPPSTYTEALKSLEQS